MQYTLYTTVTFTVYTRKENMFPVEDVYRRIEAELDIPKRVVRWYVSEKLIPQPEHQGREAFYDIDKIQLIDRLKLIKILQKDFKYRLGQIKQIIRHYENADLGQLLTMLEELRDGYKAYKDTKLNGGEIEIVDSLNSVIHNEFLTKLEQGSLDLDSFSLLDLAEKIKKWPYDQYVSYVDNNKDYLRRFRE